MSTSVKKHGWANPISISVLLIPSVILIVLYCFKCFNLPFLLVGLLSFILLSSSIYVADQWERAVVLRMGKFQGLKGAGLFFIIPIHYCPVKVDK